MGQMRDVISDNSKSHSIRLSSWRINRIIWESNRFMFDFVYKNNTPSMRKNNLKILQGRNLNATIWLIWSLQGYEILCSVVALGNRDTKKEKNAMCRVPLKSRSSASKYTPSHRTGCICCASGSGRFCGPIWWNYLNSDPY